MAIPIRISVTCPSCGVSERLTVADVSVGPRGRTSDRPVYSMLRNPLWEQSDRDGASYVSCKSCGLTEFAEIKELRV